MRVADVHHQRRANPVLGAERQPKPVGVRQAGQPMLSLDRRLVVGDTELEPDLVRVTIVGPQRDAPGVAPFEGLGRQQGAAGAEDLQRLERRPAGPGDVAEHRPLRAQLLHRADDEGVRHLDVGFARTVRRACGHRAVEQCIAAVRSLEGDVAGQLVLDLGAVGQADAGGLRRLDDDADVPAPREIIGLDLADALQARKYAETGLRQQTREIDRVGQLGLHLLVVDADADRHHRAHLVGDRRVDVDRRDFRVDRQEAADEVVVVFGLEAERCAESDADGQLRRELHRHVGIRYRRDATGIAAIAGAAGGQRRQRAAVVAELETDPDQIETAGDLPIAAQQGHAGRVEVDRAGVLGDRRRAGKRIPHPAAVLLQQLEARAVGAGTTQHDRCDRYQFGDGLVVHSLCLLR